MLRRGSVACSSPGLSLQLAACGRQVKHFDPSAAGSAKQHLAIKPASPTAGTCKGLQAAAHQMWLRCNINLLHPQLAPVL